MKKLITLTVFAMLLSLAGSAFAVIDWAGNVWPNSGADVTPVGPVDVYAQVYKGGVTDLPGQGVDLMCDIVLTNDIGGNMMFSMTYLGENGSNDEYTAQIPVSMLVGATWVDVDITALDLSDGTAFYPLNDQNGVPGPQRYNVVNVTPNDIDVTFSICLSGAETTGSVCVVGSPAELTAWGAGVPITLVSGELYEGTITFPAGSNPTFEYKFKKDDCNTWEGIPNRLVTLPTDGLTSSVVLDTQSWDNLPITCGLGNTLEEDKEVCFQVCMDGVANSGGVCLMGPTDWAGGDAMTNLGGGLFQFCKIYPAGTAIPLSVEYKFKKDDCATWESVGNRIVVIENAMDAETTLTSSWDDLGGICEPVATEGQSWDTLKSFYR